MKSLAPLVPHLKKIHCSRLCKTRTTIILIPPQERYRVTLPYRSRRGCLGRSVSPYHTHNFTTFLSKSKDVKKNSRKESTTRRFITAVDSSHRQKSLHRILSSIVPELLIGVQLGIVVRVLLLKEEEKSKTIYVSIPRMSYIGVTVYEPGS